MICYNELSTSKALNRHLSLCNAITEEGYPSPGTFLSYEDKKAAKYAYSLSNIGFADFQIKLTILKMSAITLKILSKVMKVLQ